MANYSLVINSQFKPFSYQEMLAPTLMATQAHQELENQYGELATKASVWEEMANEQTDPYAYKMYKTYANDLEEQAGQLAREGLTPASRQNMLKMKQRYSRDIVPIEQAYKRRQELIDEQRKALMANPSLMYDVDFSMTSLDDLISNPNMSYTSVSGDDLYKKGKEAAISSSSRLLEVMPALQGQYWKIRQGYGADAANKFLIDQANIPELNQAIDRIVSQSGVTSANKSRATDYVISGIMSGMSYDEKYQANRGYIDQAERERLNLAREQFEWTKDKWEDEQLGIKLPNGDRVKDVGGGRVRITHPDGRVEIMAAPKSTDSTKGQNKDKKPFSGLQFKMWSDSGAVNEFQEGLSNSWSYKRKGFTTSDGELISSTDLSNAMQTNLAAKLAEYGLTFDDVEIWKDSDTLTDNHYQVRLKQSKSNTPQEPEGFGDL
jgi:hypothetical protein